MARIRCLSLWLVLSVLNLLALAACNPAPPPAGSQIVATVNKDEISIHQVQAALQRQPQAAAQQPEAAAGRMLDVLIEQELAAQAARQKGLERDPNVVQTLEVVRREVLARAYQDQMAAQVSGPSSAEIDRYYDAHPELFAKRRIYTLQEAWIDASANTALPQDLQTRVSLASSGEAVVQMLKAAQTSHRLRQFAQASEDVPLALLTKLSNTPVGRSIWMQQAQSVQILTVLHAQEAAVDRRSSQDAITAFLSTERKRQVLAQHMKTLREAAHIAYHGSFAKAASAGASSASAVSAASAAAATASQP
jgi:EpsD family peptidyl-prolyl cis-trans isomerase